MRKFLTGLKLTKKMLDRLAKQHLKLLYVSVIVYSLLICYNAVIVPLIISQVFRALTDQDIRSLYAVCAVGILFIAASFFLSYLNNVYLDINNFRIILASTVNSCRELFKLNYDAVNNCYEEAEIQNRIDACAGNISGVFPLAVSVLSNIASMVILLMIAGKFSGILLVIALFITMCSWMISKYAADKRGYLEKKRQEAEGRTADALYHAVNHIFFYKMYEADRESWNEYKELRNIAWDKQWRQEKVSIGAESGMEALTSCMRGILGGLLYRPYQEKRLDNQRIASSFSTFDQLKSVAVNFTSPISDASACMVPVSRLEELFAAGSADAGGKTDAAFENIQQYEQKSEGQTDCIAVQHISYQAQSEMLLQEISFSIQRGEKVAVIGANGSGKSTLLRVLCGLYHPVKGNVSIFGQKADALTNEELRGLVTYIPSTEYMYSQSVKENIKMNQDEENAQALSEICEAAQVTLQEGIDTEQNAAELSGGQAQRVNIARGLIHRALLLLADEPDAGLPFAQGQQLMRAILKHSDTAVVVTHHYQYLEMFSRVILMDHGKIVADVEPEKLADNPFYQKWRGEN